MRIRFPVALALGIATGLWGLGWGIPGPLRLRIFPKPMTAEAAQKFSDSWRKLYAEIKLAHHELRGEPETYVHGVEEIAPGWDFPPPNLVNAYRAMLLQSANPDEKKSFIILSQMRPSKLQFKPLYIQYGGSFIYPLGAFLKLASALGAATVVPDLAHYLERPGDMGRLYLCGRLFMILFNLATLWVLYDIGRRAAGENAGLWAALFFCLSPIAIEYSHLLKPHPYATFWILLSLRYALLAFEDGERRNYLLSGVCCGVGGGAAFPFATFAWFPVLAWLARRRGGRAGRAEAGFAAASCVAGGLVFFLFNPYLLLSYGDLRWDFVQNIPVGQGRWGSWSGFASILESSWSSLGAGLSLAVLAGLASALVRKERTPRLLAVVFLGMFATLWLLFGRFYTFGMSGAGIRYYYPIFAVACLLAAAALERVPARWRALLLAAVLVDTGLRGAVYLENMSLGAGARSNMNLAADWIEANVPAGASVGLGRYPEPSHTPPFRYDRYRLVVFEKPEMLKPGRYPDYLVVDDEGRRLLRGWQDSRYDLVKDFAPAALGWARADDEVFFGNVPVFVYRRKG